jgi:hypothetical protein
MTLYPGHLIATGSRTHVRIGPRRGVRAGSRACPLSCCPRAASGFEHPLWPGRPGPASVRAAPLRYCRTTAAAGPLGLRRGSSAQQNHRQCLRVSLRLCPDRWLLEAAALVMGRRPSRRAGFIQGGAMGIMLSAPAPTRVSRRVTAGRRPPGTAHTALAQRPIREVCRTVAERAGFEPARALTRP